MAFLTACFVCVCPQFVAFEIIVVYDKKKKNMLNNNEIYKK